MSSDTVTAVVVEAITLTFSCLSLSLSLVLSFHRLSFSRLPHIYQKCIVAHLVCGMPYLLNVSARHDEVLVTYTLNHKKRRSATADTTSTAATTAIPSAPAPATVAAARLL